MNDQQTKVVFFDFDKTLTKMDTLLPFAFYTSIKTKQFHRAFLALFVFIFFRLKLFNHSTFKQKFAKAAFKGIKEDQMLLLADRFFEKYLHLIQIEESLAKLKIHVAAKHTVCIVSANYDCFLLPLKNRWEVEEIIATKLEISQAQITGNICKLPCNGPEKLKRACDQFNIEAVRSADAYGDSKGDYDLLKFVKNGYWVKRNRNSNSYYFSKMKHDSN